MFKRKKNKKYIILVLLLIFVGIIVCFRGSSYAKYAYNTVWDYYLKSKGFYFNSDYLGQNVIENVNKQWNGDKTNFNIKNNLNSEVITNYDINYSATCEIEDVDVSKVKCNMNGTDSNTYTGVLSKFQTCSNKTDDGVDVSELNKINCELGGYDWITQPAIKTLYFDIDVVDQTYELDDIVVNVSVTSTAPYSKTLHGKFDLHRVSNIGNFIKSNYMDFENYGNLLISNTTAEAKCIKIGWNSANLRIDSKAENFSSYLVDSEGYINEVSLTINPLESKNYIFYKTVFGSEHDFNDFTIMESNECVSN